MRSTLIIIRGNSASGKTTIAKLLQQHLGNETLLVSQDVVRRDMLKVHDKEGNLSIELIRQIAAYGKGKCAFVIVEGILYREHYGVMLQELIEYFDGKSFTYYFDLPFEETVLRHSNRRKRYEFGEDALRAWWKPGDYLGMNNETVLTKDMSQNDVLKLILNRI